MFIGRSSCRNHFRHTRTCPLINAICTGFSGRGKTQLSCCAPLLHLRMHLRKGLRKTPGPLKIRQWIRYQLQLRNCAENLRLLRMTIQSDLGQLRAVTPCGMSFCFYQLLDVTFQFFRMESEVCLGVRVARILPKPSKAFTKAKPIIACDHCWHTRLTTFSANGVFEIILVVFCARINIQHAVRTASDTYHVAPNHVLHTAEPTETL